MKIISKNLLGTFNLGENTTVETGDAGSFQHDEAVTMVSFVLEAAKISKRFCCFLLVQTPGYWLKQTSIF